ncbi:uncharacterized protein DS421_14g476650 [Arachis hypogaea]|nr:uncharacterized protein DS421_14g476650 [Arachis hypogaea]
MLNWRLPCRRSGSFACTLRIWGLRVFPSTVSPLSSSIILSSTSSRRRTMTGGGAPSIRLPRLLKLPAQCTCLLWRRSWCRICSLTVASRPRLRVNGSSSSRSLKMGFIPLLSLSLIAHGPCRQQSISKWC